MMTVKQLKQRINDLIKSGKISDDTLVLSYADEFDHYSADCVDIRILDIDDKIADINSTSDCQEPVIRDTYKSHLKKEKAHFENLKQLNGGRTNAIYIL
jgi:hypothetical protein